jgi:DNA-directed RNA polymerase sigma subunit (sigma70/sigma32)
MNQYTVSKNLERDVQILALRREGKKLAEIGAMFGLCKERVRAICFHQARKERRAAGAARP